jgi:hypothetical protein
MWDKLIYTVSRHKLLAGSPSRVHIYIFSGGICMLRVFSVNKSICILVY